MNSGILDVFPDVGVIVHSDKKKKLLDCGRIFLNFNQLHNYYGPYSKF